MASERRWIPLESNPTVLNKYIKNLGVDRCQFEDVYGLDSELLSMIENPVIAVMLLYPKKEDVGEGAEIGRVDLDYSRSLYFMKQSIPNACGTVALVHALANNEDNIAIDAEKSFGKFLYNTKSKTPEERAKILEEDDNMKVAHEESAQEGDTQAPSRDASVTPHFIAFVHKDGHLYEMDGRKDAPVNHGETSLEKLMQDAAEVVKQFMKRDPEEINFTLMALTAMK